MLHRHSSKSIAPEGAPSEITRLAARASMTLRALPLRCRSGFSRPEKGLPSVAMLFFAIHEKASGMNALLQRAGERRRGLR
jgi:hypothetical protein